MPAPPDGIDDDRAVFRTLLDKAPVGAAIVDGAFRYRYVNASLAAFHELPVEEHLCRTVAEVLPDLWPTIAPLYIRALAGETIPAVESRRAANAGGHEKHWLASYSPVRLAHHAPGVAVLVDDVTERRRSDRERQHVEHELRRSEASLANAQRIAKIGHFDRDVRTGEAFWSDQVYELFGVPKADGAMSYQSFLERVHPGDRAGRIESQRAALAGKPQDTDYRIILPDGTVKTLRSLLQVERDADGRPIRISGTLQDVTDRARAEATLHRMASIVESSDDAIIANDLDGVITGWNRGAERIFGYTAQSMVGTSMLRLIPDDRQGEEQRINRTIGDGGRVEHFETVRRAKDGRMVDVSITASPILDAAGRVIGVSKTARDITARKRAEEAQRASELRYRTLFEYAPDGIVIADRNGYYHDANASLCGMLGYSRLELIGKHSSEVVMPGEVGNITPALNAILATSRYHRQWQFRRRDGSQFTGEVIATTMPDGNLLAVVRDVTERRRAELRVERLNRVYAVLSGINETIVREKDAQLMLDAACRIAVERGQFLMAWSGLLDAAGKTVITAHAGAAPDTLQTINSMLHAADRDSGCAFTDHALTTGRPGVCNDLAVDPRAESWRAAALQLGYLSMVSLPLTVRERVIGTMNLYSSAAGTFDTEEMRLLGELAADLAFGLEVHEREREKLKTVRALRDSESRLRTSMTDLHAVSSRLNAAREQERVKMARDIHDHLGQALTALKMDVVDLRRRLVAGDMPVILERLAEMSALIDTSVSDVRRVAAELRPVVLDDLGFVAAIRAYLIDVERRANIRCVLSTGLTDLALPDDRATALFRILQEALTNVVRHADARHVDVGLTVEMGRVRLIVHDDGRGVPPSAARNPRSLGLVGMRDRALLFGGKVQVSGGPGEGTRIDAELPLDQESA